MKIPRPSLPTTVRGWALLIIAAALAAALAGGGSWMWHRHKLYRASPVATVDTLNSSLSGKDARLFVQAVDCNELAVNLAKTLMKLPDAPLIPPSDDPEELKRHSDRIQLVMLALLQGKDMPAFLQQAIVQIFPDDFLQQLAATPFTATGGDAMLSYAETTFDHPVLGKKLSLRLLMQRINGQWTITRILNAGELARLYNDAVTEELRRRKEKEGLTKEEHKKALARYLPDITCQAGVTRISGQLPILVLTVHTGVNPGPENIDAWGITLNISDASGHNLAAPRLTSSEKIVPKSGVADTWNEEIPEEKYQAMEAADQLVCRPVPQYAILSNGKILQDIEP